MNKYDVFGIEETRFPDFTPYRTLAIDLETHDPDIKKLGAGVRRDGYVVGIAIATYPDLKSYYFPIAHKRGNNFKREQIIEYLKPTLERRDITLVGANLVYDIDYLIEMGFDIKARLRDVQIAEPLLDENKSSYKLEELGQFYFGEGKSEEKLEKWVRDYMGSKADVKGNIWQAPSEIVAEYARQDAVLPLRILKEQLKLIDAQGLRPLYDLESDILPLLIAMKRRGVHVNLNLAEKLDAQFSESLATDKKRLDEIAGFNVNYMSNDSLKFLCDQQGFSYSKTRTGKAQFQQAQIKNKIKTGTQQEQEVFELILNLRQASKSKGTFVDGYVGKYQVNGKIHCQFNQLRGNEFGTVTGRFSSSNPNLQNIPKSGLAREMFIPDPNHIWVKMDYKAIEPRVSMHFAKLNNMEIDSFINELRENPLMDIYKPMMDKLPQLTRSEVKAVFLGISYSMGAMTMAKNIKSTVGEAKRVRDNFNAGVPYLNQLSNMYKRQANDIGLIKTIYHRQRRFNTYITKDLLYRKDFDNDASYEAYREENKALSYDAASTKWGKNRITRAFTYKAFNALIQGSSADIMKKAMLDVWRSGICDDPEIGVPLLTVHDELDFSIPQNKRGVEAVKEIKHIMENAVKLHVPLIVEVEKGSTWGTVQEWEL